VVVLRVADHVASDDGADWREWCIARHWRDLGQAHRSWCTADVYENADGLPADDATNYDAALGERS